MSTGSGIDVEQQWNDEDSEVAPPPPQPTKSSKFACSKWVWVAATLLIAIIVIVPLTVTSINRENENRANQVESQVYSPAMAPALAAPTVLETEGGDVAAPAMAAATTLIPDSAMPSMEPTPITCAAETQLVCPANNNNETTNNSSDWTQVANDIVGEAANDLSGFQISMSCDGSIVAVGAGQNDGNGDRAGHVRVFRLKNSTEWEQLGDDLDGEAPFDWFGHSVSLAANGLRLAVGGRFNDGNGKNNTGHVRVFDYIEESGWTKIGADIDGEADGDQAGRAVSISADGTRVAIGASANDGNGLDSGHVRVYELDASNWVQLGQDIDGEATMDRFGRAVALSADGTKVAVGAYTNDGGGEDAGHVRIFGFVAGNWTQIGQVRPGNKSLPANVSVLYLYSNPIIFHSVQDIDGKGAGDWSGLTVAISYDGNRVAVGAPGDNNRFLPGLSQVYEFDGAAWVQLGEDLQGGYAVSLSEDGNRVAAGDYKGSSAGPNSGEVNVYEYDGTAWALMGSGISGVEGELSGTSVSLSADGDRVAISSPVYADPTLGAEVGATRVYDLC